MGSLEAVVAHGAGGRKPNVNERCPSLQLVVSVAVKEIGSADGDASRSGFDRCKGRVIVHGIVGEENLLPAPASHVQRRKIVEGTRRANAPEEPAILFVPEGMWLQSIILLRLADSGGLLGNTLGRRALLRSVLRPCGFHSHERNKKQRTEEPDSSQFHHFDAAVLLAPGLRIIAVAPGSSSPKKGIAWFCCRIRNAFSWSVVIPFRRRYLQI